MEIVNVVQGSYEWHCLRHGNVTGTTLKSALGTPRVQETLLYSVVANRMTEVSISEIRVPAIIRGHEMEPIARKAVAAALDMPFVEVGTLRTPDFPGLVVSPDGVFMVDGVVVSGIEIKCPDSKKHVEYLIKDELPGEYFHQVYAPFLMDDRVVDWYFVSFDDRNYECPIFIKRVTRADFEDIDLDRERLSEYLQRVDAAHTKLTF